MRKQLKELRTAKSNQTSPSKKIATPGNRQIISNDMWFEHLGGQTESFLYVYVYLWQ